MDALVRECEGEIRLLVASDVTLYCEGLERVFRDAVGIQIVAMAAGAAGTLEHIRALTPGVVLLDMAMKDAFAVARQVPRISRATRVVAFGVPDVEADVINCAESGIAGFVPSTGTVAEAFEAVHAAARGEVHCSPKIAGFLFRHIAALSEQRPSTALVGGLTAREAQILRLLQQGLTNKLISRKLGIELPTVKNHVHSLLGKLGVHRRAEAVSLVLRQAGQEPE